MTLEKYAELSRIEIDVKTGHVSLRVKTGVIDNETGELAGQPGNYRSDIEPHVSPDLKLSIVDANLQAIGLPALTDAHKALVTKQVEELRKSRGAG